MYSKGANKRITRIYIDDHFYDDFAWAESIEDDLNMLYRIESDVLPLDYYLKDFNSEQFRSITRSEQNLRNIKPLRKARKPKDNINYSYLDELKEEYITKFIFKINSFLNLIKYMGSTEPFLRETSGFNPYPEIYQSKISRIIGHIELVLQYGDDFKIMSLCRYIEDNFPFLTRKY